MVTKWRYKVVQLGGAGAEVMDEQLLNSLGDQGWDLVSVTDYAYEWQTEAADYIDIRRPGHSARHGGGERSVAYLKKEVTRAESGSPGTGGPLARNTPPTIGQ